MSDGNDIEIPTFSIDIEIQKDISIDIEISIYDSFTTVITIHDFMFTLIIFVIIHQTYHHRTAKIGSQLDHSPWVTVHIW